MGKSKSYAGHTFQQGVTSVAGYVLDSKPYYGDVKDSTGDIVERSFLLCDFDIDWDEPKSSHKTWLDDAAKFMAFNLERDNNKGPGGWEIRIDGYTSKTYLGKEPKPGDPNFKIAEEHNRILSNLREQSVEGYLRGKILNKQINWVPNWHGFLETSSVGESPQGRSVLVHIQRPGRPAPKPVPPPPPPPVPADVLDDTFKIRLLGSHSGGDVIVIDIMEWEIWAVTAQYSARFTYTGVGGGASTAPYTPTLGPGPWNYFQTRHVHPNGKQSGQPVAFGSFEGPARFTTGGAGDVTLNVLSIMGDIPPGIIFEPHDTGNELGLLVSTGTTLGAGVSSSVGAMVWTPRKITSRTSDLP